MGEGTGECKNVFCAVAMDLCMRKVCAADRDGLQGAKRSNRGLPSVRQRYLF